MDTSSIILVPSFHVRTWNVEYTIKTGVHRHNKHTKLLPIHSTGAHMPSKHPNDSGASETHLCQRVWACASASPIHFVPFSSATDLWPGRRTSVPIR